MGPHIGPVQDITSEEVEEAMLKMGKAAGQIGVPNLKPNLSLYSPYYAEACNELAVPISAS